VDLYFVKPFEFFRSRSAQSTAQRCAKQNMFVHLRTFPMNHRTKKISTSRKGTRASTEQWPPSELLESGLVPQILRSRIALCECQFELWRLAMQSCRYSLLQDLRRSCLAYRGANGSISLVRPRPGQADRCAQAAFNLDRTYRFQTGHFCRAVSRRSKTQANLNIADIATGSGSNCYRGPFRYRASGQSWTFAATKAFSTSSRHDRIAG